MTRGGRWANDLQIDLFAATALSGFSCADDIITLREEAALIDAIERVQLTPFQFHGWLGKRVTASFGWKYDFDDASFGATDPIPDWLLPLRARAASFAGLQAADLVQALLIRYDPGAGIGWHRDRPIFDQVVGISLGVQAMMRFRRRTERGFDRTSAMLEPRSIYHLTGEARHNWEHSIAAMDVTRWSVTFRSLSEQGRRLIRREV